MSLMSQLNWAFWTRWLHIALKWCGKVHFTPQSFGNIRRWHHGNNVNRQSCMVASSETWNRAEFGLTLSPASILCDRQDATEFFAQSTGSSQGICWAALAIVYARWKSLYRGAQPNQASPKWTRPVKRKLPDPGLTPHCSRVLISPLLVRRLLPVNRAYFWRNTRVALTLITAALKFSSSSTDRMLPRTTVDEKNITVNF